MDEHPKTMFNVSFEELRQEVQELRDQMKKIQVQVESDVMILQRQMYQYPIIGQIAKQISAQEKGKVNYDIHNEVDDFLKTINTDSKKNKTQ